MIGIHPFFNIIATFALSKYLEIVGRNNLMMIGCVMQALGSIL